MRDFHYLFDEKYYEGLEGGILEAFGKLFPDNTYVYVYPSRPRGTNRSAEITLDNVQVPANLRHLLDFLKENNKMISLIPLDDRHMHIGCPSRCSVRCAAGGAIGEKDVPEVVARRIVERKLMGFDSE